jgi:hypothetical protein
MSADIISGASSDLWTIDPSSKAGRVTLYDGNGLPISGMGKDTARGAINVLVRQTAATGAGATVWAVRNTHATKRLYITRIVLQMSFDGTGAATLMRYELLKGINNTALTGGAAVTPSIDETDLTQSVCGLTVTGVTYGGVVWGGTHARMTPSATVNATGSMIEVLEWPKIIELKQNEVLGIRNGPTNASVIGDSVFGSMRFVER